MIEQSQTQQQSQTLVESEQLLTTLLHSVGRLLPYDVGVLAIWDNNAQVLFPYYAGSTVPSDSGQLPLIRLGEGIIGTVAQTQVPLNIPDVTQDARYREIDPEIRSELAVPILRGNRLLGVFDIESRTPNAFQAEHVAILEALAEQAAMVIETSTLYNRLRANYFELQDAHTDMLLRNEISRMTTSELEIRERLPHLAQIMGVYGDADACVVAMGGDTGTAQPLVGTWHKEQYEPGLNAELLGQSIWDLMRDNNKAITLNGIDENTQLPVSGLGRLPFAMLIIPFMARGNAIGAILMLQYQQISFTTRTLQRMQFPIDQISLGIDSQRLLRVTREHLTESQSLLKLSEMASRYMDFNETIQQVLSLTKEMLSVAVIAIFTYDRQDNLLIPMQAGFGFEAGLYKARFPANAMRSLLSLAFNSGHPQYINADDLTTGPDIQLMKHITLQNILVAPLRVQDDPLGVILVGRDGSGFEPDDGRLLTAIGSHVASALRNSDYLVRLRLFRGLSDIANRVSGELASEQVLVSACESVVDAITDIDHAGIVINDHETLKGKVVAEYPVSGNIGATLELKGYPIYEQMMDMRGPVVINDVAMSEDILGPNYQVIADTGIKSLLVVPLIVQNEIIGSLGLDAREKTHHFTEAEVEFVGAMAGQIATSIRNAQLFEELQTRSEELAEANRLKSEFLAKMSHELRTPMNSILGFSEAISTGIYGDLNERQADRLNRIRTSGRNLLALIDDLLDLSKIEAGRMELQLQSLDLHEEITGCLSIIEAQVYDKQLYLNLDYPDGEALLITADRLRLRQVINNLLSNALKFTAEGGVTVKVHLPNDNRLVRVDVIDTGIGIKPEHLDIIFDEFRQADGSTTRKFGGTGLGLAISRYLVQMMGGRLWVESVYGEGSSFIFTVPLADPSLV